MNERICVVALFARNIETIESIVARFSDAADQLWGTGILCPAGFDSYTFADRYKDKDILVISTSDETPFVPLDTDTEISSNMDESNITPLLVPCFAHPDVLVNMIGTITGCKDLTLFSYNIQVLHELKPAVALVNKTHDGKRESFFFNPVIGTEAKTGTDN